MARKRSLEDRPPASSSEEENGKDESSEDDDDDSQNDAFHEGQAEEEEVSEDELKTPLKKQATDIGKDGSDSESDSDKSLPSPSVSDFTIKPIVVKPKTSAPKSSPKLTQIAVESSSKKKKPPSSESSGGDANVKTPGTSRLWSEADEIAILEGMIEYKSKKGSDPNADSSGFHDFIKQSIQADVTKNQLTDKIRRLKKKYKVNAEKGQHGNDPVLPKAHDHKSFELSKKIWGNETNDKKKKIQKKTRTEFNGEVTLGLPCFTKDTELNAGVSTEVRHGSEEDKVGFWKDYPRMKEAFEMGRWGYVADFMKELLEKYNGEIGRDKLSEMESVWRELRKEELQLFLKRLDLVQEVAQAALNVIKGSEI